MTTRKGIREGVKLLLIAACLSPLVFLLERLLPSRENTIIDELPQLVFSVSLMGLALTGLARIIYSALTEPRSPALPTKEAARSELGTASRSSLHLPGAVLPAHDTPASGS